MFPPATLLCIDRLITALMTLVRATAHIATGDSTETLPQPDAHALFHRLAHLVRRLIHISHFGLPAPRAAAEPAPNSAPITPHRVPHPNPPPRLPRRPGWLLAALPDAAPAAADDLRPLLADPAIATLLDAAPNLHRAFRPLLRALGLQAAPPAPAPPSPTVPGPNHQAAPNPAPSSPPTPSPPIQVTATKSTLPTPTPSSA